MKNFSLIRLVAGIAVLATSGLAHAQSAKLTAVQAVAEKRAQGSWSRAGIGTDVRTGDGIRTGKRSKADLKFADGSLIRLGQLSTLEIQADREARLASGQLLFSFLKPGRILAGAGAAEIKGTAGIITIRKDGEANFVLYRGVLDVVTRLRTIQLKPGTQVNVSPEGVPGRVLPAAPLEFAGGQRFPELLTSPQRGAFVGSGAQLALRDSNQYRSVEILTDQVRSQNPATVAANPFVSGPTDSGGPGPLPTPFPSPTSNPVPTPFPTLPPTGGTTLVATGQRSVAQTGDTTRTVINTPPASAAAKSGRKPAIDATFESGAQEHLAGSNGGLGSAAGSDVRVIGGLADGGATVFGGRIHAFGTKGHWYLDGAVTPLRTSRNVSNNRVTNNQTTVTDLSLTYRNDQTEVQAGRQRYLEGPTQATLYGSLIRSGGREIMDALRVQRKLNEKQKLEFSYLFDSYVRDLPYSVPGRQKGFSGRFTQRANWGNLGVNLLQYSNAPGNDTLGATVDLAFPLIRDQLELYGEAGRDPFRRNLTSVGVYLPGLYQKTGFDVYVEWAKLKGSSAAAGPPNETAVRVYRRINKYADAMLTASRFSGGDSSVVLGISIGDPIHE